MKTRAWFRMETKAAEPSVAEFHIIDLIGSWYDEMWRDWGVDPGVTAKKFIDELSKLTDAVTTIRVHINSPGGDVFAALNIANALREQQASKGRTVETVVDGLAASAASIIAMAGSKITMADNALMMIHNPWTWSAGEAKDFRKTADDLDTIRTSIVATYKWHSQLSDQEIAALMDAETWMDADEAIKQGFATDKVEGLRAAAALDRRASSILSIPEKFSDRVKALLTPEASAPQPASADEVLRLCTEASLDLSFARTLIDAKVTDADVRTRIAAEKDARAKSETRKSEITALCKKNGLEELAGSYISGGMTLEAVKAQIVVFTAKIDGKTTINTDLNPGGAAAPAVDVFASYAALNGKKE